MDAGAYPRGETLKRDAVRIALVLLAFGVTLGLYIEVGRIFFIPAILAAIGCRMASRLVSADPAVHQE